MNRDAAQVAADAIAEYVASETAILSGIAKGPEDMKVGHTMPHGAAMAWPDAAIGLAAATATRTDG